MDEDAMRALFYGLCGTDGEAQYDAGLYVNIRQTDGKTYVLLQNESESLRHVQLSVEEKFAVQYLGMGAVLADGVLSCTISPGALCFLALSGTAEPGLYDGNVRVTSLQEGKFSLYGVSLAALYTIMPDGSTELTQLLQTSPVELSRLHPQSRMKLFFWNTPLSPTQESQTLFCTG